MINLQSPPKTSDSVSTQVHLHFNREKGYQPPPSEDFKLFLRVTHRTEQPFSGCSTRVTETSRDFFLSHLNPLEGETTEVKELNLSPLNKGKRTFQIGYQCLDRPIAFFPSCFNQSVCRSKKGEPRLDALHLDISLRTPNHFECTRVDLEQTFQNDQKSLSKTPTPPIEQTDDEKDRTPTPE